jgi:zinc protease
VLAARTSDVPLLSLEVVLPAGAQLDLPGREGLATLTASLVDEGTEALSAMDIAAVVERLGGTLFSGADWDVAYLGAGLLAKDWKEGFALLVEVLTGPAFPPREVERLRQQRLAEILRRSHDPSVVADETLAQAIYDGTPYGGPLVGTRASVEGLRREDCATFFDRHYGLDGAAVIAVGDLAPEELLAAVDRALGSLPPGAQVEPPPIEPRPLAGTVVHIVDRPGAAQTELRVGHAGISRTDPRYTPAVVMNTILGGKFTSRINLSLRERHAFTYGASSRFYARRGPGPFVVTAAVATESAGTAAREVIQELRRLRDEPVTATELSETASYLVGVFPYTVQTIGDVARRLETIAIHALPDDDYDRYLERLGTVSAGEIQEVARELLQPDHLAIVAVGPAQELAPQFAGMGEVKVVDARTS